MTIALKLSGSTVSLKRDMRLSGQAYANALRTAIDPDLDLRRFHEALTSAARWRRAALGGDASERLRFATNTLIGFRIRGARRYLDRAAVAPDVFSDFLRTATEMAVDGIDHSTTPDEIADVLEGAMDSLHSYLLVHNLVAPAYGEAEDALAREIMAGREDDPPLDEAALDEAPPSAADNELALAA
jgi:hypothetical protein